MEENDRVTELLEKAILSLNEWKELMGFRPHLIRSAPQYIKDCLEFYGIEHESRFDRRYTSLKALQLSDKLDEHLIGHGTIQARLYEILTTLCRDNSKMILLVGPNGSAKSTLWNAMAYALAQYSKTPHGARYTIEWVFPHDEDEGKRVGFAAALKDFDENFTFAFMDDEKLDKIIDDSGCSPAWLFEKEARRQYFNKSHSKYVLDNELSPQAYKILQEIINVYKTKRNVRTEYSPDEVLKLASRHIRIRKTYISKTYQEGLTVIDPGTNPIFMTQKSRQQFVFQRKKFPYLLKNIEVPELTGPLSKSSNGMMVMEDSLEGILQFVSQYFNDKRKLNIDGDRYTLDIAIVGSINPEKFNLLRQDPEYNRFRTRLEIINVPYLLDYELESTIYGNKMNDLRAYYHIAPHTEELFGMFCVMARLEPLMQNRDYNGYDQSDDLLRIKDKLRKFTLLDKAKLYHMQRVPEEVANRHHLSSDEQTIVNRSLDLIFNEWPDEGRTYNFSYREVDAIIDRAMIDAPHGFLSPISLMKKLNDVIRIERDDYPFLKESRKEYSDLLLLLDDEYFRIINEEMRDVFRFDYEDQIVTQIEAYLVRGLKTLYLEKGKIKDQGGNDITEIFLREREQTIFGKQLAEDERQKFWYDFTARVQPGRSTTENIKSIFESQIYQARDRMYQSKQTEIEKKLDYMLVFLEGSKLSALTPEELDDIRQNVDKLMAKGYNRDSAKELIGYLKSNLERLVSP
ncbi:MAG: hypothetical protein ACAI44_40070 [Candidatus Sericytochromatia bacterium]